MEHRFKTCPFCQEQIRANAIKCRFCGEYLPAPSGQMDPGVIEIDGVFMGAAEPAEVEPSLSRDEILFLALNSALLAAAFGGAFVFRSFPNYSGLPLSGIGLFLVLGAALVWGVVALARQSECRRARIAAAGFAVLGAGVIAFGFLPPLIEKVVILAADFRSENCQISLNDAGTELDLDGPLRFGTAHRLRSLLDISPEAEALRLTSSGGRISEAREIAGLVRERKLKVTVKGRCLGPAIFILLAGAERAADKDARIGLAAVPVGWGTSGRKALIEAFAVESFRDAGVKRDFAVRALATSPADPWFPEHDALVKAGVLTEPAADCSHAAGREVRGAEEPWSLRPLFQKVKLLDPGLYARLADKVFRGIKAGETHAETASAVRRLVAPLARRHLLSTSDRALIAFRDYALRALEALGSSRPAACIELITFDARDEVDDALDFESRAIDIYEQILCESSPGQSPHRTDPAPEQAKIQAKLDEEFGPAAALMTQRSAWRNHSAQVCPVLEMFCRETARAPRERQPLLLRSFARLLTHE